MANNNFYNKLDKVWTMTFDDGTVLTNEDIYMDGGIKIHQTLCDEEQLTFGLCVSDYAEITLINKGVSYIGKKVTITVGVTNPSYSLDMGTFTVTSETVSSNKSSRKLVAYDGFIDIFDLNIADWYNSLTFPITIKNMRTSFFTHFNIPNTAGTQSLIFDSYSVSKTIDPENMTGKEFITCLCEMNGVFGRFRQGSFQFRSLSTDFDSAFEIQPGYIVTESHEDFTCEKIDKLQIRQDEYDIGAVCGTGDNCYIVEDNFFFYGLDATTLGAWADKLFNKIKNIEYVPIKMTCQGNPSVALGEQIKVKLADNTIIKTYVLKKTLKGPQALRDEIVANGVKNREEKANGVNSDIIQLKGKTNRLIRNVDGLTSEVYDSATGVSRITQNAQAISAKVSAIGGDGSSFGWNLTADGFVLTSNGSQVFKCDAGGITVSGYASASSVSALSGRIDTLDSTKVTAEQVNAQIVSFGYATVDQLNAKTIDASKIVSGTISADRISTASIESKFLSPDAGTMTMGTMRAANLYIYNGTDYKRLNLNPNGNVTWS